MGGRGGGDGGENEVCWREIEGHTQCGTPLVKFVFSTSTIRSFPHS